VDDLNEQSKKNDTTIGDTILGCPVFVNRKFGIALEEKTTQLEVDRNDDKKFRRRWTKLFVGSTITSSMHFVYNQSNPVQFSQTSAMARP
jgi:hypothetical protein